LYRLRPSRSRPLARPASLPDIVIDALLAASRATLPPLLARHRDLTTADPGLPPFHSRRMRIPDPPVSWARARDLVIAALTEFDPRLGALHF